MGKGQAAILLVIVAVVVIFLFFSPQIFRSQPTVEPIRFRNDIISLENFQVSNIRPIQSSVVTVSFDVINNGDKKVDEVTIDLSGSSDVIGGGFVFEECELHHQKDDRNKKCIFRDLESLEARRVAARFQVGDAGTQKIEVRVKYPYSGIREAFIPILDDETTKTSAVQFRQSQPSFGPFAVDIIPPTKAWAISNQPFEIKFKLRFVGSTAVGTPTSTTKELKIEESKFVVDLSRELEPAKKPNKQTEYLSCQFKPGESKIESLKGKSFPMVNIGRDILVNEEYVCNLQAVVNPDEPFGYKIGTIKVDFDYIFEFQKSQQIIVVESK